MLSRRDFLQVAAATTALGALPGGMLRAAARQAITQAELLAFEPLGQVTLLHIADLHAQLVRGLGISFLQQILFGAGERAGLCAD